MTKYDNTNRFSLFVNDRKEKDTQPDRTGTLNVDGVEYFIDGWLKTAESGRQYLQGTIKRKEQQPQAAHRNQPQERTETRRPPPPKPRGPGSATSYGSAGGGSQGFDDDSSDIPF